MDPQVIPEISSMDIYLIDQIMKGRYQAGQKILDAGCASGRNLKWFIDNDFEITACDIDESAKTLLSERYQHTHLTFVHSDLAKMPFEVSSFDHVLCNAVLHFAQNTEHFKQMWHELHRVCRPGGSIFIRTCTDIGIVEKLNPIGDGRFIQPDGYERFLLTRSLLDSLLSSNHQDLLEPVKWTSVNDQRVMMTLVLKKS